MQLFDTVFHPSGKPSLTVIRELLKFMPCAAVIADADSSELLAFSTVAEELFGINADNWLKFKDLHVNRLFWSRVLADLELSDGGPLRRKTWLSDKDGNRFPVIGSVKMIDMVGRRVFIITIEPLVSVLHDQGVESFKADYEPYDLNRPTPASKPGKLELSTIV